MKMQRYLKVSYCAIIYDMDLLIYKTFDTIERLIKSYLKLIRNTGLFNKK